MKIKIKQKPAVPAPAPKPKVSGVDFLQHGWAVVLKELAEAKSMAVRDVLEFPDFLAEYGLPPLADIPPWVRTLAHKLHRDACDGCLFRLGESFRAGWKEPPERPPAEVAKIVAGAEAQQAERKREEARAASRTNERRTEVLTKREQKALEAKEPPISAPVLAKRGRVAL